MRSSPRSAGGAPPAGDEGPTTGGALTHQARGSATAQCSTIFPSRTLTM